MPKPNFAYNRNKLLLFLHLRNISLLCTITLNAAALALVLYIILKTNDSVYIHTVPCFYQIQLPMSFQLQISYVIIIIKFLT